MKKVLVTGGLGFMGSDFVRYLLDEYSRIEILNYDKMTYAANPKNLAGYDQKANYHFVRGDIADKTKLTKLWRDFRPEAVVNFAAETHVDRSIASPRDFIITDVEGTFCLLETARALPVKRFIQVSTDEVYGSIKQGAFDESSPIRPNSPYSASKAGGDLLVRAYHKTFNLPVVTTRSCNNFGPFQYPEKVIPLFITNLIENKKVPLYGTGKNVRTWIYVRDHSRALNYILRHGKTGEVYNIATDTEISNLALTDQLLKLLDKDNSAIERVKDRPGHDFRYSLGWSKLKKLGWQPNYNFDDALLKTVKWYQQNKNWWEPIKQAKSYEDFSNRR